MNWLNLLSPRKTLQALRIESAALRKVWRHGRPDAILHFLGGIGDELMLTCVAHEMKKRRPGARIWQISHASSLLENNPDYALVLGQEHWALRHSNLLERWRIHLQYASETIPGEHNANPAEHVLAALCRRAGIDGAVALRPYFHPHESEVVAGRLARRQFAIQAVGHRTHETWMQNKLWFADRFQKVVDGLQSAQPDLSIVQLGTDDDVPLRGVIDLRGKTSLRQTASILQQSECFVGTSGFLSHLARAVECRSVIIYGGKEHSTEFGYVCNENLDSHVPCAPCGWWNRCDYGRRCMDMISVSDVLAAIHRALQRKGVPLETQVVEIADGAQAQHKLAQKLLAADSQG